MLLPLLPAPQVESDMFHLAFSVLHREQECADAVQEAVVKANAGCTGGFWRLRAGRSMKLQTRLLFLTN